MTLRVFLPRSRRRTGWDFVDFTKAMSHLKPRERALLWLAYAEGATRTVKSRKCWVCAQAA